MPKGREGTRYPVLDTDEGPVRLPTLPGFEDQLVATVGLSDDGRTIAGFLTGTDARGYTGDPTPVVWNCT